MPRITVEALFPIVKVNYALIPEGDHFIRYKRQAPLWNKLTPVSKLLHKSSMNTNLQNVFPQGVFKIGELVCIAAKSPGISKLTIAVVKVELDDKP